MRLLSRLLAIALVLGLTSVANAAGFQMVVVDPPSYVNIITDPNLTVTLGACHAGQVPHGPGDPSYDGCFTGLNDTGKALTSLELLVPVIPGYTPTCFAAPGDVFSILSCNGLTNGGKDYLIEFSGGIIPTATDCDNDGDGGKGLNGDDFNAPCNADSIFTIAESGIPYQLFPADFSVVSNAPEPNSLWLLSTGILSVGLFFGDWRRRTLCRIRG